MTSSLATVMDNQVYLNANSALNFIAVDSSGGWDNGECGISYECRTLIFKALHNLIEK